MEFSIYSPAFLQDVLSLLRAGQAEGASIDALIIQIEQRLGHINASLYPSLPIPGTRVEKEPARIVLRGQAGQTVQAIEQCPSCQRAPLLYMGELREEGLRLFACRACRFSRIEDL